MSFEIKDFKFLDEDSDHIYLSVVEVVAMILRHAKKNAEKMAKIEIKDCIITVPSNWNLDQR